MDEWKVTKEKVNGVTNIVDKYKGKSTIETVEVKEYLGTYVACDGTNAKTIEMKVGRGQGIVNDIMMILSSIPLGKYYFETAVLLRSSLLLSVLTHDIEVLHNITKSEIKKLESIDNQLISKVLETSTKTSICVKMLELGLYPIAFIIKKKRIIYFQRLLKSEEKSLAKKILITQMIKPKKGDFAKYVKDDLEDIGMQSFTVKDFEKYSSKEFKQLVSKRIKHAALKYLVSEKDKQKKGQLIKYDKLEMQSYLKSSSGINTFEAKCIFNLRSNNLDVAKISLRSLLEIIAVSMKSVTGLIRKSTILNANLYHLTI